MDLGFLYTKEPHNKRYITQCYPCGKCIECLAQYAHTWAISSVFHASTFENNCFLTLTYDNDHLGSDKLDKRDRQLFFKALRDNIFKDYLAKLFPEPTLSLRKRKKLWNALSKDSKKEHISKFHIDVIPAGEYGEKKKRKHWHFLIFNYCPNDLVPTRKNKHGDQLYWSKTIWDLWKKSCPEEKRDEIGELNYQTANYVCRYALKKLKNHGKETEWQPMTLGKSKKIAYEWLKKNYKDIFSYGELIYQGKKMPIPRRFVRWLETIDPEYYTRYVTQIANPRKILTEEKTMQEQEDYYEKALLARELGRPLPMRRSRVKEIIHEDKLNKLTYELD